MTEANEKNISKTGKAMAWLSAHLLRAMRRTTGPWMVGLVAAFAFIDLWIVVIPVDAVLIVAVWLSRKRWLFFAAAAAVGSALGAVSLAIGVNSIGSEVMEWVQKVSDSRYLPLVSDLIIRHGAIALFLVSVSFIPQQAAVVLCALARLSIWKIGLAVLLGRGIKYLILAWAATFAPEILEKMLRYLPALRRQIEKFKIV